MKSNFALDRPLPVWARLLIFIAPILCGGAIFYQTLHFAEVWDDAALLLNPLNGSATVGFKEAWLDALRGFSLSSSLYWRPLGSLSFWAPHQLCGPQDPDCLLRMGHQVNYILYAAFCVALSALAILLARLCAAVRPGNPSVGSLFSAGVASLAASFVIFHPANAEIFAWISGRFDGMATLFITAALISSVASIETPSLKGLLVFAFCSLAQLSKDGAAFSCALVGFVAFFFPIEREQKKSIIIACVASVVACWLLRWGYGDPMSLASARVNAAPGQIFDRYLSSTAQAFTSLTQPWIGVSPVHPIKSGTHEWIQSALFHWAFALSAFGLLRSKTRHPDVALGFAFALALFGSIMLTCGLNAFLLLNQDFVWADRYLAPAWPFLLGALAILLRRLLQSRRLNRVVKAALLPALVSLSALFALTLSQEITLWRDNPTFWGRVTEADPQNIKSVNNYTHALFQSGKIAQANEQADRGLGLMEIQRVYYPETVRTAASIKFQLGRSEEALALLNKWQSFGFDSFDLRAQRALIYFFEKRCLTARQEQRAAVQFARSQPRYKTEPDLVLMAKLSRACVETR